MTTFHHSEVSKLVVSAFESAGKAEVRAIVAIAVACHGSDDKSAKSEASAIIAKAGESLAAGDERELRRLAQIGRELASVIPAPADGATLTQAVGATVDYLAALGVTRSYHARLWKGNGYAVGADGLAALGKRVKQSDGETVETPAASVSQKLAAVAVKLEEVQPGSAAPELFRLFADAASVEDLQQALEALPALIAAKQAAADQAAAEQAAAEAARKDREAKAAELRRQLAELEAA